MGRNKEGDVGGGVRRRVECQRLPPTQEVASPHGKSWFIIQRASALGKPFWLSFLVLCRDNTSMQSQKNKNRIFAKAAPQSNQKRPFHQAHVLGVYQIMRLHQEKVIEINLMCFLRDKNRSTTAWRANSRSIRT